MTRQHDYNIMVKDLTSLLLEVKDLDSLAAMTTSSLVENMAIKCAALWLYDRKSEKFISAGIAGPFDCSSQEIANSRELCNYLLRTESHFLLNDDSAPSDEIPEAVRADLLKITGTMFFRLIHNNTILGILSIGERLSGRNFTSEDGDMILPLANCLVLAINNAGVNKNLSYSQTSAEEKGRMAEIKVLASEIKHDICNPLGIIRGQCEMFVLNHRDGIYGDCQSVEVIDKAVVIMQKVIKEADRATGIAKQFSTLLSPGYQAPGEGDQ